MCDHNHHHGPSKEEQDAIAELKKVFGSRDSQEDRARAFARLIHKIGSPMDLVQHDEQFGDLLELGGYRLRWGRKASHSRKHAYVLSFGEGEGEVFTIQTDMDLHEYEQGVFPWENYDLFED